MNSGEKIEIFPEENKPFTEDDLDNCWLYYKSYLVDILNGIYSLHDAREDLRSLISSKFDMRKKLMKNIKIDYEKIDSGVCPNCNNKLKHSDTTENNGWNMYCDECKLKYVFHDDLGPGCYSIKKI